MFIKCEKSCVKNCWWIRVLKQLVAMNFRHNLFVYDPCQFCQKDMGTFLHEKLTFHLLRSLVLFPLGFFFYLFLSVMFYPSFSVSLLSTQSTKLTSLIWCSWLKKLLTLYFVSIIWGYKIRAPCSLFWKQKILIPWDDIRTKKTHEISRYFRRKNKSSPWDKRTYLIIRTMLIPLLSRSENHAQQKFKKIEP